LVSYEPYVVSSGIYRIKEESVNAKQKAKALKKINDLAKKLGFE
jgi:hypothetical protein